MQEKAEDSATYLMHAEHAKLATRKKKSMALYCRARHMLSSGACIYIVVPSTCT